MRELVRSRAPRLVRMYRRRLAIVVARDRRHPRFSRWARAGATLRDELGTAAITFEASGVWIRDERGLEWLYDPDVWLSALGKELGLPYDEREIAHVRSRLSPGGAFIDVGAHVGGYSIPVAVLAPDAAVHAIEPAAETRSVLELNLARNSLQDRVRVWPYAIGDEPGRRSISTGLGGSNHLLSGGAAIEVRTLDSLILPECPRVDVVKCDIEGGELAALRGGATLLRRDRPDVIVELDRRLAGRYRLTPEALVSYMRGLGYRPSRFGDGGEVTAGELDMTAAHGGNCLFRFARAPLS